MPRTPTTAAPPTRQVGPHSLPLGGKNGFLGVSYGQGKKKNQFRGTTPRKTLRTALHRTALEAAVELAEKKQERELASLMEPLRDMNKKRPEVGTYLGHLLRPPPTGIQTVASALLSQQEAAEAAARGVAVAYARVRA